MRFGAVELLLGVLVTFRARSRRHRWVSAQIDAGFAILAEIRTQLCPQAEERRWT